MSNPEAHITNAVAEAVANRIAQHPEVQAAAVALRPENFAVWFANNQARFVDEVAASFRCDDHANQAKVVDPFTDQARWVCEGCGADCGEA